MLSAKCLRHLTTPRMRTLRYLSTGRLKSVKVLTFTIDSSKPLNLWDQNNARIIQRTCTFGSGNQTDSFKFEEVCEETLESLCDYFEELVETSTHLKGADVLYGDGVLTVSFGEPYGTYVINRQSPNKQIWLSSPTSGPKRYDFIAKDKGAWVYKHDGVTLHGLLQMEINKIVNNKADFSNLLKMEVMEEGNLMDRVPILLQRDFNYYEANQTVLQERICSGVVGGKLDFPRNASFASVKLVMWWEEEFVAAFRKSSGLLNGNGNDEEFAAGCGGVVKASDPDKFVSLVVKSSELLLEHLHILSQEALDHADLPVLTATLGAAALIKNSLHCFIQASQYTDGGQRTISLQAVLKNYAEMAEALAERVLDLHGRLLALYVLQGEPGNGGSPSVRMWWLYMQGTKQDLWDTVPPKMAQRVFAGMLNETLTILTVRYTQEISGDNNSIMMNDILNILICVTQLLPAICAKGEELIGVELTTLGKIIRDVHAKCHELLVCLLLRGAPLHYLFKIFKQPSGVHLFDIRPGYPSLWYILSMPHLFPSNSPDKTVLSCMELSTNTALALELYVYLAQPQPLWPLLLKVLLMRDCYVSSLLLKRTIELLPKDGQYLINKKPETISCEGFLCSKDGSCLTDRKVTFGNEGTSSNVPSSEPSAKLNSDVVLALTHIVLAVGSASDMRGAIIQALESTGTDWAASLDRRQLWVLKHPPWLTAILSLTKPILPPIAQTLINAVQTGASMYQAMSLCLTCLSQLWDCLPQSLFIIAKLISHVLPATSTPVGESVLLQFLIMAVYEELISIAETSASKEIKALTPEPTAVKENKRKPSKKDKKAKVKNRSTSNARTDLVPEMVYSVSFDGSLSSVSSVAMCLAEALCSIDEDNKHTEQIQKFLQQIQKPVQNEEDFNLEGISELLESCYPRNPVIESVEVSEGSEVMVSQLLMTSVGKNSLQVMHQYITKHSDWLLVQLGAADHLPLIGDKTVPVSSVSLLYTMFYIGRKPFDQFLHGSWVFDWTSLLNTPLSLTAERAWTHIARRPEFQPDSTLTLPDAAMIAAISAHIKELM